MSGPILPNAKGVGGSGGARPVGHSNRDSASRAGCSLSLTKIATAGWLSWSNASACSMDAVRRSIHSPGEGASISSSSRTASRNPSAQSKNAPPGRTGPGALVFPNERHRFSVVLIDGVRASPYLENSVFWRRVSILLRLLLLIRDNPSYEFPSQL